MPDLIKADQLPVVDRVRRSLADLEVFANRRRGHPQPRIGQLNRHDEADQRSRHATFPKLLGLTRLPNRRGRFEIALETVADHPHFFKVRDHADFATLPQSSVSERLPQPIRLPRRGLEGPPS